MQEIDVGIAVEDAAERGGLREIDDGRPRVRAAERANHRGGAERIPKGVDAEKDRFVHRHLHSRPMTDTRMKQGAKTPVRPAPVIVPG